ncbi:MAG: LPXTG cell wall anchor domain-containing protein, partial [Candidatus Hodarchaeota archaeon]
GEIVHDPTFSAITSVSGGTETSTTGTEPSTSQPPPTSTTGTRPSPGFALFSALIAGVALTLLMRRRKNKM